MGILDSLAVGLRQSGGILNPQVAQGLEQEQQQQQRVAQQMAMLTYQNQLQNASPANQLKMQQLQNDQGFRQAISQLGPSPAPEDIANLSMKFGKPEVAAQMYNAQETRAARIQAQADNLQQRKYQIDAMMADRQLSREQQAELASQSNSLKLELGKLTASIATARRIHPVVGQDANGNQVVNWVAPSDGPVTLPTKAIGTANIDYGTTTRYALNYQNTQKPVLARFQPIDAYQNLRSSGDNAQAAQLAVKALQDSLRLGGRMAAGSVSKLLGSGYGGGSLAERLANYASQLANGTPSDQTMKNLDSAISAAEDANMQQTATNMRTYSGYARARNIEPFNVVGEPIIRGNKVVFPEDGFRVFPNADTAAKAVQAWKDAHYK